MIDRRRQTLFALVGKFNNLGVSPPEKFYETAMGITSNFGLIFEPSMDLWDHPLLEKIVFEDKEYVNRLKQKISELNDLHQEFERYRITYQDTK